MAFYKSRAYEKWVPVVARVLLGAQFLMAATFKIPGTQTFAAEVAMTGAAGVPFATIAVALAFLLELCAGVALIIGWHAREAALLLAVFSFTLAFVFYRNFADQAIMAEFISCISLMAALLYVSVYGARTVAVRKDTGTV